MDGTCSGLAQGLNHGQHGLGLLADNAPWSYVLLGIISVVVIAVAVATVRAVREGRSVELYKWGIKIGSRPPQPSIHSAPTHKPSQANAKAVNEQLARWRHMLLVLITRSCSLWMELSNQLPRPCLATVEPRAVSLSGEGGRGKTAVAYEAVKKASESSRFTRIVWAAAKSVISRGTGNSGGATTVYWADVVRVIAAQLDCPLRPSEALWQADLRDYIKGLPPSERILLVVDNLEGIRDVEKVLDHVRDLNLTPPHKLIATTRWRLSQTDHDVKDIETTTIDEKRFAKPCPPYWPREHRHKVSKRPLSNPNFEITEGNPYLIKLIVSRYLESGWRSIE